MLLLLLLADGVGVATAPGSVSTGAIVIGGLITLLTALAVGLRSAIKIGLGVILLVYLAYMFQI